MIKKEASNVLHTRPPSPASVTNFIGATATESTSSRKCSLANDSQQLPSPTHELPTRLCQFHLCDSSSPKYPSFEHYADNVHETTSMSELAMYHHQSLGYLPRTTQLQTIRKHPNLFHTFPGLKYNLIRKYLPMSTATLKGHMIHRQQFMNWTSNTKQQLDDMRKSIVDMTPMKHVCATHKDEIFCFAAIEDKNKNTLYNNLTGQFPVRSFEGISYIFVAYVYKLNAILLCPMKSRKDGIMIAAFTRIYSNLEEIGHKPTLHVLNNECSRSVHIFFKSKDTTRQHVEDHHHNANAAKIDVKPAKYHIISHSATLNKDCPVQLWREKLPQIQDTLNMLRKSRKDGTKTVYEELHGAFN